MRIVFASSEVAPFSKTGGLGDVASALPRALGRRGHEVLVFTPLYGTIDYRKHGLQPTGVLANRVPLHEKVIGENVRAIFIEHDHYFGGRAGVYGDKQGEFGDNAARFTFFSRTALAGADALGFGPVDIVHLNDWPTGVAALELARWRGRRRGITRSVFTIHNMGYQGTFRKQVVEELGLGWDAFTLDGFEFHDYVNFLKCGLAFSDALTTVSPTYAREIQTVEGGFELDGLLRARSDRLTGILNGVDLHEWDPATDKHLPANYSAADLSGKAVCRTALCREVGIEERPDRMILGIVSRFAEQKGFDLLLQTEHGRPVIDSMLASGQIALVALGSGDGRVERMFERVARTYPDRVGVKLGFDEGLAHRIEAGVDAFLMPSRYEPCGLNQMYSLRYGTVPIVRRVGGLADSVERHDGRDGGTGFFIDRFDAKALAHAVGLALGAFLDRPRWRGIQLRGMARDVSWDRAAAAYEEVYRRALSRG